MTAITLTNTQIRAAADLADKRKRFRRTLFIVGSMGLLLSIVLWYVTAGMTDGRSSQGDRPFWHELDESAKKEAWQPKKAAKAGQKVTYATGLHHHNEQLFAVTSDGRLIVFTKKSGAVKKRVNLKDHSGLSSSYSFYGNLLYQQTEKLVEGMVITQFAAYELPQGKLAWKKVSQPALAKYPRVGPPPTVIDKRVVFCRYNNYFHTYGATDGTLKWICPTDEPSLLDKSAPYLASHLFRGPKRLVYLTNEESRPQLTHTRNELQKYKWPLEFAVFHVVRNNGIHTCRRVVESPVQAISSGSEKALLLLGNSSLQTIVIASGENSWSKKGKFSQPIIAAGRKMICRQEKEICAFAETTGEKQYVLETKAIKTSGELDFHYISTYGKTLFLAGRSPQNTFLAAFDLATGKHRWSLPGVGVVNKDPQIIAEMVVFNCADGRIYGVNAKSGAVVWRSKM